MPRLPASPGDTCGAKARNSAIRRFVLMQAIVPVAVAIPCAAAQTGFAISHAIVGAQASLLGLWIGLGASRPLVRCITTLVGLTWLGLAMLLCADFNEWLLVLLVLRTGLVGGVSWGLRGCTGYVLGTPTNGEDRLPFQFQIRHLLGLMLAVALVMGIMQSAQDTEVGMYLLAFLIGAGFAAVPLVACWAVFGRGPLKWRIFAFTVIVLLIVSALSFTAYWQTGYRTAALLWWLLWGTIEAAFLVLCLWWLHRLGYRITRRVSGH